MKIAGQRRGEAYPTAPRTSSAGGGGAWTLYTPAFDSTSHDADIGNGELTGTYLIPPGVKTCKIQLALTWGDTSNAGTGSILVPLPPGVTPDFSLMATCLALGNAPVSPVVATGSINGSPIAISADFVQIAGQFVTSAPINTLEAGSIVFLSAEFPIL